MGEVLIVLPSYENDCLYHCALCREIVFILLLTKRDSKIKFTDISSSVFTVLVVPVPDKVSEDVLILQECETVLMVVVIGLVPHPVVPGHTRTLATVCEDDLYSPLELRAVNVPGPVAPVVLAVGAVHRGAYPPLLVPPAGDGCY